MNMKAWKWKRDAGISDEKILVKLQLTYYWVWSIDEKTIIRVISELEEKTLAKH